MTNCYVCGTPCDSAIDLCEHCSHLTNPLEVVLKRQIAAHYRRKAEDA